MLGKKILFSLILFSLIGCMENKNSKAELTNSAIKGANSSNSGEVSPLYPVNGGNLRIALTDAPNPDVSEVWVNIDRIELKAGSNSMIIAQNIGMVDLLTLQNGTLLDLGEVVIPIGIKVNQARLILKDENNHLIYKNGDRCDMQTPSQQNTGLKLISPEFEIREGQAYSMIIDFDAKKSLVFKGNGGCLLKPVLKWASLTSISQDDVNPEGGSSEEADDLTNGQDPDDSDSGSDDSSSDGSDSDDSSSDDSDSDDSSSDDSDSDDSSSDDSSSDGSSSDDSSSDGSSSDDSSSDDSSSDGSSSDGSDSDDSSSDDSSSDSDGSSSDDSSSDGSSSDDSSSDGSSSDDSSSDGSSSDDSSSDGSSSDDSSSDGSDSDGTTEPVDEMAMCKNTGFDLLDQTQWPNDLNVADYEHCF